MRALPTDAYYGIQTVRGLENFNISGVHTLRVQCVDGIMVNPDVCQHYVDHSIGTVMALNPLIGYDGATELASEATRTGRGILELVRERRILSEVQIAEGFDRWR